MPGLSERVRGPFLFLESAQSPVILLLSKRGSSVPRLRNKEQVTIVVVIAVTRRARALADLDCAKYNVFFPPTKEYFCYTPCFLSFFKKTEMQLT